jgi:lipopolysaccharide assembly protein A
MHKLLWLLRWILKAAIFFTLFAFALNNQHEVIAHFFFGQRWAAPLVVIVLIAFTAGLAIGVLGMVPRWWRYRKTAQLPSLLQNPLQNASPPAPPEPRMQDGSV